MHPLVKAAYRALPLKKQVFTAVRAFGVPGSYRRMYFGGPFGLTIDAEHAFLMVQHNRYGIETELFWNGIEGGWETASLAIWMKLCRGARVILDIGAAEGLYALVAKCLEPAASVHAFEPFARPFAELERNVALNAYDITTHQVALSNFVGDADFYATLDSSNEGSLIPPPNGLDSQPEHRVRVTTLVDMIGRGMFDRIDLLKIDVEGAEPHVLEGMGPCLARFRPSMIVEILDDDAGRRVQALVDGLDYLYFDINDDARKGPKSIRPASSIRKGICLNYLLVQRPTAERLGLA
jgi:FkbM family methyltransferase